MSRVTGRQAEYRDQALACGVPPERVDVITSAPLGTWQAKAVRDAAMDEAVTQADLVAIADPRLAPAQMRALIRACEGGVRATDIANPEFGPATIVQCVRLAGIGCGGVDLASLSPWQVSILASSSHLLGIASLRALAVPEMTPELLSEICSALRGGSYNNVSGMRCISPEQATLASDPTYDTGQRLAMLDALMHGGPASGLSLPELADLFGPDVPASEMRETASELRNREDGRGAETRQGRDALGPAEPVPGVTQTPKGRGDEVTGQGRRTEGSIHER